MEEKRAATEQLLQEMGTQRADAEVQRAAATVEAEKANAASAEAAVLEGEASGACPAASLGVPTWAT